MAVRAAASLQFFQKICSDKAKAHRKKVGLRIRIQLDFNLKKCPGKLRGARSLSTLRPDRFRGIRLPSQRRASRASGFPQAADSKPLRYGRTRRLRSTRES